jgi:TonB family protein
LPQLSDRIPRHRGGPSVTVRDALWWLSPLPIFGLVACGKSPEGRANGPVALASATLATPAFRAPRPIKEVPPIYPKALEGSGKRGDVTLELRISVTGKVTGIEVQNSLGPEFDEAALAAARQWEYTPAIFKGAPALMYLIVKVHFEPPRSLGAPHNP